MTLMKREQGDNSPELSAARQRLLSAVHRGASMAEIADLKPGRVTSPAQAIQALIEGNARFFDGSSARPELGANERRAQIIGQTPFAAVLACSDSRVPVELIFDQGFGDLFVARIAGNVVADLALGTLEYAIQSLNIRLIMVLGHEGCGAVTAALSSDEEIAAQPPALRALIRGIQPSVKHLPPIRDKKARMREAVLNNVRHQVAVLRAQDVARAAEASGQIQIIGGFYEIGSGAVDFLISEEDLQV